VSATPTLVDLIHRGVDELRCTCGAEVMPDCSLSAASIQDAWHEHLMAVHGVDR
jgi:hypothetical protein